MAWIAFTSNKERNADVYISPADGSHWTDITNVAALDTQPNWGKIAWKQAGKIPAPTGRYFAACFLPLTKWEGQTWYDLFCVRALELPVSVSRGCVALQHLGGANRRLVCTPGVTFSINFMASPADRFGLFGLEERPPVPLAKLCRRVARISRRVQAEEKDRNISFVGRPVCAQVLRFAGQAAVGHHDKHR